MTNIDRVYCNFNINCKQKARVGIIKNSTRFDVGKVGIIYY